MKAFYTSVLTPILCLFPPVSSGILGLSDRTNTTSKGQKALCLNNTFVPFQMVKSLTKSNTKILNQSSSDRGPTFMPTEQPFVGYTIIPKRLRSTVNT